MSEPTHIRIVRAREHNLKGVDLEIPRDALVVFTGVSGSGKSSLAFDTIHKEGQRRFMESLSAYARQFLGQMERPKVDAVDGISPTLCIDQKTVNRNPRSTVGTITEIHDHLRLLMARLGTPHCPECGLEVGRRSVAQIVDHVLQIGAERKVQVLGPVVRDRKGEYRKELEGLRRDGWVRARIDGAMHDLESPPALARYEKHTIEVVVDRLKPRESDRPRLAEAVETALRLGQGVVTLLVDEEEHTGSTDRSCIAHPEISIPELEPRLFSFNAPQGACPTCNGLGQLQTFDPARVVDEALPPVDAFQAFNDEGRVPFTWFDRAALAQVVRKLGGKPTTPVRDWPARARERLLFGDPELTYVQKIEKEGGRVDVRERPWRGLVGLVEQVWGWTSYSGFHRFIASTPCPDCHGARLNPVARAVTFRERGIVDLATMSVRDAHAFFVQLELEGRDREVGELLVGELRDRLTFLVDVGLGYLTLDRSAATLSGGEAQRIRLASSVGSGLQGVTYILDEPSIGLHPRDNARLLHALGRLRDRGNSVLVVEHDEETIDAADFVVDVGPGAGRDGGHLCAVGTPAEIRRADSPTGRFLRREDVIEVPPVRRAGSGERLVVRGADLHNLKEVDLAVPLGTLTVVTGVSGSGKSTLVFQVLEQNLVAQLQKRGGTTTGCRALEGVEHVDKVIRISQQPIGRTPRSNPATYTGVFDAIRDLFAKTPEARARGYKKGRFSFNVKGGRCEACEGAGVKTVEMQFLPSVEVPCDVCDGRRFNAETLEITWGGHTIYDVLEMTVAEAARLFGKIPKIARILGTMEEVGLGYVPLGQPSTTISGGEAQRVKLATELHRPATGRTIYLLDEPTTGLHFADVKKLLHAIQRLVDAGNTVVVVEHHHDVIKCADHLVDLGPEGGGEGGQITGQGTPEAIARLDTPTGRALAALPELGGARLAAETVSLSSARRARQGPRELLIQGARKHNLQSIDVRIPHGKMTVITGPSGSGKTSLAFDTIFAEGQRRYVESLSTYARRFLGRLDRAPLDRVEGLAPAIAIDQANASHNPRSTVATVTEIQDVLRLLYARVGTPHCPDCDVEVRAWSPSEAAADLKRRASGAGWLLAPLSKAADGEARRRALLHEGWQRLRVDGEEVELQDEAAAALLSTGAELVVDRLDPARSALSRIAEAVASAYALGRAVRFVPRRGEASFSYAEQQLCPTHGVVWASEITPRHFSFNSRIGACPRCEGLGTTSRIVPERLFPQPERGFWDALDGRVSATLGRSRRKRALIAEVMAAIGIDARTPVREWTDAQRDAMLDGLDRPLALKWSKQWGRTRQTVEEEQRWPGLMAVLDGWNSKLAWLSAERSCPSCGGGRLRREVLAVRLGGLGIDQLTALPVEEAREAVAAWPLTGEKAAIAERPLEEIRKRLAFLCDVGLGYLALDRPAQTLSGGESQRIRLASQLGSGLTGVIYVLDEPTIGLHPRDTERLLGTLEGLRDLGNTLVVVEHDPDTIRRADHVLDLGPEAGRHGGNVVASGTPAEIEANPRSVTGRWLAGTASVPDRGARRAPRSWMTIRDPQGNNLRCGDVAVPTGVWVGVSGVSGSGKSTLVMDTLAPALERRLGREVDVAPCGGVHCEEPVDRVVVVDQSPIGRTPRSTAATYVGVMDPLRQLFASTPGAMERGWAPGRFSFNAPGGRCELCEGRGAVLVEMHFLPDVWVECESCRGKRYDRETLAVRWKGHSIADVLAMRADEAWELFRNQRSIGRKLKALVDVGLGYLTLGQPGTTLSGGEAQRVKLASELTSRRGHCVYVLDEPTTGLHLGDVAKLIEVLHRLVDKGHTVITIEHHLEVLAQADWILDLGPEGGAAGGQVIAEGTPESVEEAGTATGVALREGRRRSA